MIRHLVLNSKDSATGLDWSNDGTPQKTPQQHPSDTIAVGGARQDCQLPGITADLSVRLSSKLPVARRREVVDTGYVTVNLPQFENRDAMSRVCVWVLPLKQISVNMKMTWIDLGFV
jgi:hypothetical protein